LGPGRSRPALALDYNAGVRVIETPLLDPEGFDFIGTRHAAERLGIEIVCLLGLPDELDVLTQAD